MKSLEIFAQKLAEKIFKRTSSRSFTGQRLLATGFPDTVLDRAADLLASSSAKSESTSLKLKNVIFVLSRDEYNTMDKRISGHKAYQAGLSYCVNVRDRGETAVFFVRKSLIPFMDESLKEKGSVLLSNLGITSNKILKLTLEECFADSGWSDEDFRDYELLKKLVFERCKRFFLDDRTELLCFDVIDKFFSLRFDQILQAKGFKTLCLIPVVGELDVDVSKNIKEIDRLREALAAPAKKNSYLSEHEEYDPEAYRVFKEFLENRKWRVPLETDSNGKEYLEFFLEWPTLCDVAFLECAEKGSARIDLTGIKGGSGRKLNRFGSFVIIDESEMLLEWKTLNLVGCAGEITVDGDTREGIPTLDVGRTDPINTELLTIPVGKVCKIKIRPEQPSDRRRLRKNCRDSINVVRLDLDQDQALILFGKDQILVVKDDDRECIFNITPPPSMTANISSRVFHGFRSRGDASIHDDDTDEKITSITFQEGESVFISVDWEGKPEPSLIEVVCQEAAQEAPKSIDSLISAFRDARGKLERFSDEYIQIKEEWTSFPYFNLISEEIPEFAVSYEARRTWSNDLLSAILDEPQIFGPRAVLITETKVEICPDTMDTKDGIPWGEPWNHSWVNKFLKTRFELFKVLKSETAPLPFLRLSRFEDLIRKYVFEYFKILEEYIKQNDSYGRDISYYSPIDTLFPIASSRLPSDGKLSDTEIARGVFLLPPTHPVRLLWLLRREQFSFRLFQTASDRSVLKFMDAFDGFGFPANIVLPNERVYYNALNPEDAFWGTYVPEDMPLDGVTTALASFFPERRNRLDNPLVPDSKKISAAMDYSHRVLPYRETLRIGYSNPGSAQCLRDALSNLPKTATNQKHLHHALFNHDKTRFRLNLIGSNPTKLGDSFSETIKKGQREELPTKLEIQRSETGYSTIQNTDLSFADDIAARKFGSLISLKRCPPILPLKGLICPLVSRSRLNKNATGEMVFAFAHPAPDASMILDDLADLSNEDLSSQVCYQFQGLFRNPTPTEPLNQKSARAFKVEYRQDTLERVRIMQGSTTFLFTLDTNSDLAMFEAMAAGGESIIIDFDPVYHNPVAKLFSDSSHNYVITSSKNSPVKKKLKSELLDIFGDQLEDTEDVIDNIFSVLNGLSGRFLKEMLQSPPNVKEAIGCGLSSLLVRQIVKKGQRKFLKDKGKTASAIIPIDDHFMRWLKLAGQARATELKQRADLIFATIYLPQNSEYVEVWLRILEIKLGYHGQSNVAQKAYSQIKNTWEIITQWLKLEPSGYNQSTAEFKCSDIAESLFRMLDLASILDFYVRRASRLMPELVQNFQNDEEIEDFCNIVYKLIVEGKGKFIFDLRNPVQNNLDLEKGLGIVAGHILHFNPEIEEDLPLEEKGISPTAFYRVIGRQTMKQLLTEN